MKGKASGSIYFRFLEKNSDMNISDQIQQLRWEVEFNKSTEMPRQHGF